jgi:hypothetical protein
MTTSSASEMAGDWELRESRTILDLSADINGSLIMLVWRSISYMCRNCKQNFRNFLWAVLPGQGRGGLRQAGDRAIVATGTKAALKSGRGPGIVATGLRRLAAGNIIGELGKISFETRKTFRIL